MTPEEIDAAYEIDSKVPDAPQKQARYVALSGKAATIPGARLDIAYGQDTRHRLDVFAPEGAGAPVPAILFFHGGYWKGGSKENRRFPAPAWMERGYAWVGVEYRLAPDVSLDAIVDDARKAVGWFHANASEFGCDPGSLHIAGNSAGGHLTAMLMADGWQQAYGIPADALKSGTAVSGLFDFDPLLMGYTDEWLKLDGEMAARNSPLHLPPRAGARMAIAWGGLESDAFRNQSEQYADACRAAGASVEEIEREEHDHFSIIGEFGEPDSPLFQATLRAVSGDS